MAKLSWAQKLNNRLQRNWGVKLDTAHIGHASACGKRNYYDHDLIQKDGDYKYKMIYKALLKVTKNDNVTITPQSTYEWDERESALYRETEYYGTFYNYAVITVTTPTGRHKLRIDTRYVR